MQTRFPLSTMNSKSLCLTVILLFVGLLGVSHAVSTTVTFDTDFMTGVGAGEIVSQGPPPNELARIFNYRENSVYATAIPFSNPNAPEPSHFHLFNQTTLPGVDNIGLLMGDDASGVSFTVGGMNPTIPFDVLGVNVVEVGTPDVFLRSFRNGSQLGEITLNAGFTGSPIFNSTEWGDITRFTATFGMPGAPPPDGGRLVLDNLQVNAVPEPATIGLFATGLAGLWSLRRKNKAVES